MSDRSQPFWGTYRRAENFLPWKTVFQAWNTKVFPKWIGKTDRFIFTRIAMFGEQHVLVDPRAKTMEIISELDEYLPPEPENDASLGEVKSPDKTRSVFVKDYNIWMKDSTSNELVQLTKDGQQHWDYGTSPECNTHTLTDRLKGKKSKIIVLWSPDSSKIVTMKIDQRKVKELHILQNTPENSFRPEIHGIKYALPGDQEIPTGELIIIDVNDKFLVKSKPFDLYYWNLLEYNWVWWSSESNNVFFTFVDRHHKKAGLYKLDLDGKIETIIEEKGKTFVDIQIDRELVKLPNVRIMNHENGQDVIWWSQRDDWGHLYRYDGIFGQMKNQITSGNWNVFDIVHVDEGSQLIYFVAGGKEENRDPYFHHLYRVKFDGTGLELLTPENAFHDITFSPSGQFFIDTYSRIDSAPVSVLKSCDGGVLLELDRANIDLLLHKGWKWPEPFKVKGRDGKTDIYGAIYYPTNFDSSRQYPVIDFAYPGPQRINTPKFFPSLDRPANLLTYWEPQTLAELGFIVITVDGFGTPYRSKTFLDHCYNNLGDGGLEDHIQALEQLEKTHPFLDLDRVGIAGHSGGGYIAARGILKYPEFYKVAVASAGNHDMRTYLLDWCEKYLDGLSTEELQEQSNASLAENLKGHLLLVHGELDDNVHISSFMRLVDALIEKNKDFDMLMLPNRNHIFHIDPYFIRKRWDYFIRHLLGKIPPANYTVKGIDPKLLEHLTEV